MSEADRIYNEALASYRAKDYATALGSIASAGAMKRAAARLWI